MDQLNDMSGMFSGLSSKNPSFVVDLVMSCTVQFALHSIDFHPLPMDVLDLSLGHLPAKQALVPGPSTFS